VDLTFLKGGVARREAMVTKESGSKGMRLRFATVLWDRQATLVGVLDEAIVHLAAAARALRRGRKGMKAAREVPADMLALIGGGPSSLKAAHEVLRGAGRCLEEGAWKIKAQDPVARPLDRARWLSPIPRPAKNIVCVGRNYAEHAKERGSDVPTIPVFFTKPSTTVVGNDADVVAWPATQNLDYEVELAVVIGKRGRDIPKDKAYDHVFGYTILNDITARDVQKKHQQWFKGKSLDTFAPLGPWIVHKSALPDPHALRIALRVNGEGRQEATTADMVFRIEDLIEVLSVGMTLEPGDILATGTPSGVAAGFVPPQWLKVGDVLEAEVEGIGVLRNRIVAPGR
jgi:2-keto-4-pentenoate hydratase/2-oxohepta-3-ene-1,7-dioic acid hydratase in catechol pathway